MGWYIAFLLVCAINGAILTTAGLNLTDIRFWVLAACQAGSYILGRLVERGDF